MYILALSWLIISVFVIFRLIYRMGKEPVSWGNIIIQMQTIAIGMLIFPKYLDASEKMQEFCIYLGIGVLSISFIFFIQQSGIFKIKSGG